MTERVNWLIIIFSIIVSVVIFFVLSYLQISVARSLLLQFYGLVATISITILGFYITAISILMFVFKEASNDKGNPINIIKSARSYPQLYSYFMKAIYAFGATFLVVFILYLLNLFMLLPNTLFYLTVAFLCLFLIMSMTYGALTIYLFSVVVSNFVKTH